MKRTILTVTALLFLIVGQISGDTHYVSKVGTNIYPYQSWETAADSISKAMDASQSGDTVRVGVGTYYEHVVMKTGIALIGAGRDSCVIDIHQSPERDVIIAADSMIVEGFHIIGKREVDSGSIGVRDNKGGPIFKPKVNQNSISNCYLGIFWVNWMDATVIQEICNNIIFENRHGIWVENLGMTVICQNTFYDNSWAINCKFGKPIIKKNVMLENNTRALEWILDYGAVVKNNIVSRTKGDAGVGMTFFDGILENNTISDNKGWGLGVIGGGSAITNNVISKNGIGVEVDSSVASFNYNNIWGNVQSTDIRADTIEDNISADPMFTDEDNYRLQFGSPCIDAGDPSLLDVDGSRSDMGSYGGSDGEKYDNLDLAPATPESVSVALDSFAVMLDWLDNTESDLFHYMIYRDTVSGFMPGMGNSIGTSDTSEYQDDSIEGGTVYYYSVSAWDKTGHESPYSEEVTTATTGIENPYPNGQIVPVGFRLLQNFPNPFNARTDIRYVIPSGINPLPTSLIIFDVLGRQVRVLVDEEQRGGYYFVGWDGNDDKGQEAGSGVYFCQLRWRSEIQVKKMLLVK